MNIKREIQLFDDSKMIITKSDSYSGYTVNITKCYVKDNTSFSFVIWDDISFRAYSNIDNINEIEFIIDINDPLYFCFKRLLNGDKKFIIDDDETSEILEKYMAIEDVDNNIKIKFVNNLSSEYDFYRFYVFIKNIGPDPRSKIDNYKTKIRIIEFLRDCENILLEECHQITMDEYLETINQKRYVKKI